MPIPHASGLKGSNTLLSKHDTEPVQYAPSPRLAAAPRRPRSDTWPPAPVVATGWRLPRMLTSLKRQDSTIFSVFPKGTLSSVQVALSVVSALMGAGNLALPFAVAATGWVFVAILAGITGVCCYTANLLVEVIERVQPSTSSHISNYEKLAEQVLGKVGLQLTSAVIFVELFGCGVGYLILLGSTLNLLFPSISTEIYTVGVAVVLYPTLLVSLDVIASCSVLGVISAGILLLAVLLSMQMSDNFYDQTIVWQPQGLGLSVGIAMFTYAGHAVVPEIHASAKNKEEVGAALTAGFGVVLMIFTLIGAAGYMSFGPDVDQQFTMSLPPGPLVVVCGLSVFANVALSFGLLVASPCKIIENLLWPEPVSGLLDQGYGAVNSGGGVNGGASGGANGRVEAAKGGGQLEIEGGVYGGNGSGGNYGLADDELELLDPSAPRPLLRLGVVAAATAIAVGFPDFALVLSLIGCVCDMTICFILPAVMHMACVFKDVKESKETANKPYAYPVFVLAADVLIIIAGCYGMVMGTVATLQSQ